MSDLKESSTHTVEAGVSVPIDITIGEQRCVLNRVFTAGQIAEHGGQDKLVENICRYVKTMIEVSLSSGCSMSADDIKRSAANMADQFCRERFPEHWYKQYQTWCEGNNLVPLDGTEFKGGSTASSISLASPYARFIRIVANNFCVANPDLEIEATKVKRNKNGSAVFEVLAFRPDCMMNVTTKPNWRPPKDFYLASKRRKPVNPDALRRRRARGRTANGHESEARNMRFRPTNQDCDVFLSDPLAQKSSFGDLDLRKLGLNVD